MAFSVSPAVTFTETDLTNTVANVSTSTAATVIQALWGPVEEITIVADEDELLSLFGKPNDVNYKDWLSASSFLSYAADLRVIRAVNSSALNATASASAGTAGQLIKNREAYDALSFTTSTDLWVAKYPGALGNAIAVAWADTAGFNDTDTSGDYTWSFRDMFDSAPAANEFHVVVYDATGAITGTQDSVLERFAYVSSVPGAKYYDGSSGYFKTKINDGSAWIYVAKTTLLVGSSDGVQLAGGADGTAITSGDRQVAYNKFQDADSVDVSLLFTGGADIAASRYVIDNIAEYRKDCVACVSVMETDVVGIASESAALANTLVTRTAYGSSSYAFMDSAYKLMYDKYNDVNRWVPLNGDTAGLMAKIDNDKDSWYAPAGFNNGRIKNAIRLAPAEQKLAYRNELFKNGVNPCAVFKSEGPILFGDKTLLTRPSAFDAINVRRLFIVLEKAIATAAKYYLFQQNNDATRTRFVNMVDPFLRTVLGREGIIDYAIVCDGRNNTSDVIDRNEFVADIYIKPTRTIRYIRLNFTAVRTGVAFEEIVQGSSSSSLSL